MDRSIPMLLLGLVFGSGIGFTVAAGNGITLNEHDHANPLHHTTQTGEANAAQKHASRAHGKRYFVKQGPKAPSIRIKLEPDLVAGWNLQISTNGFRFAPERASLDHVEGEGHAHVYLNGKKHSRIYGHWVHLSNLPIGPRARTTIRVGLYTNDHRAIYVGGRVMANDIVLTSSQIQQALAKQAKP